MGNGEKSCCDTRVAAGGADVPGKPVELRRPRSRIDPPPASCSAAAYPSPDPLTSGPKNPVLRVRLIPSALSHQAGGNSIKHDDSPDRADQKENFSDGDFHAVPPRLSHRPEAGKLESNGAWVMVPAPLKSEEKPSWIPRGVANRTGLNNYVDTK